MKDLKTKIRLKRIELNHLYEKEGIDSSELLKVSHELDELINEFQKKVIEQHKEKQLY